MKYTCTIIIFNFNSIGFLRLCIKQIMKCQNENVEVKIIIADQSTDEVEKEQVQKEFSRYGDIEIVQMAALRSGYAVDYIMRNVEITTEWILTLDCDFFVTNKNFIYLPIKLAEEYNFSIVGELFFESRPEETAYYHKNNFFCMSQCFRLARTEYYKELSMQGGFTILHARPETGFTYGNNDWWDWAQPDYINRGSDDGVIAHCWEDNHLQSNKCSLAITHILGEVGVESGYGRILDGLGFHLSFSFWSNGIEDRVGKNYMYWKQRIIDGDENVLDDMIAAALKTPANPDHPSGTQMRRIWNGKNKTSELSWKELNQRIEELKIA